MKLPRTLPLVAALMFATTIAPTLAQDIANPPASTLEQAPAIADSTSTGTSPEGMGSTGETGSHRGQTMPETTGKAAADAREEADQPLMATGTDLKGPAMRFPATKTPE